jgi:hypothetical protein
MMRQVFVVAVAAALVAGFAGGGGAAAAPADDYAKLLQGPWGRVDVAWKPYTGVLAKNSCPPGGVTSKERIGLFGEGGTMWIEPGSGGALSVYDGALMPRSLAFARAEAAGIVYRDAGGERRFTLVGATGLTEVRLPEVAGMPGTNYMRCQKKK